MPQYTEGPEAKGMETGFALDELLRSKRAASVQQARQLGASAAQTNQQHQNRLSELMYGEQLKEQGADREAARSAPFLQNMIAGNPTVAKAFGFADTKNVPGELPVAEAGYAGTPDTTKTTTRVPSLQEVTGLSRAVPGIASQLIGKSMDPNAGYTLNEGDTRFNAQNQLVAQGAPKKGGASFATMDEAMGMKDRLEQSRPELRGRVTISQSDKGYNVSVASTEPLSAQDPLRIGYFARVSAGMDPNKALEWYISSRARMRGEEALQVNLNTPPTPAQVQEDRKTRESVEAFNNVKMMSTTAPQLVREFLSSKGSAVDIYNKISRIPGVQSLVSGMEKEDFIRQYNEWSANVGRLQGKAFDEGGKQLTSFEAAVVYKSIPTTDDSPQEFAAKMKWMDSYVNAQQGFTYWLRTNPKYAQDPAAQQQAWKKLQRDAGISTETQYDWRKGMQTPDEKALSKIRAKESK